MYDGCRILLGSDFEFECPPPTADDVRTRLRSARSLYFFFLKKNLEEGVERSRAHSFR